jgi:hypothetical protein
MAVLGAMAGSASAAGSPRLTRVERPRVDQVVGNGKLRVVLRTRASLGAMRVLVDGRSVERFLHRSARGYRGALRLGQGLHYGVNELIVVTRGSADFDRVRFIVARRNRKLLSMSNLRVGGRESPARVVVRAARRSKLQAWVNGHRVEHAFQPKGHAYVGRLGANDWVRPGRNRLVVLAHRSARSGRAAVHDVERATFRLKRGRVIAGAGRDRVFSAGGFIVLRGSTAGGGSRASGAAAVEHRWRIVGQPPGARATLQQARSARPELFATAPGYYRIRTRVSAPNGSSSVDTVTAVVREDVPPIGWRLDTTDDFGTITLNGKPVADTTGPCDTGTNPACPNYASYAVFNRQTLKLVESGTRLGDSAGMAFLADRATAYAKTAPTSLMVVNLSGSSADLPDGRRLLATLGVAKIARAAFPRPVSIVGVPGSPAGSAFISDPFLRCAVGATGCSTLRRGLANMSGYLRLNPLSATGGFFEFVFTDQVEFDTDASTVPNQIVIKVGSNSYTYNYPAGSSGFFHVRLDGRTLQPLVTNTFVTNGADGTPNPTDITRLAGVLAASADGGGAQSKGSTLVLLQAFGTPRGLSNDWLQAAAAVGRLGGNAQVFAQLNQGNAVEPHQGRYAFVGRAPMDTNSPAAESSQSLTGRDGDGKLHGLIARGRDAQYEPLIADPAGTVNFDLVKIVNRPPLPDGGFPPFTPGQAHAAEMLGRDPDVIGVCASSGPCDVRRAYWEKYVGTSWSTIVARLGNDATKAKCAKGGEDFTPDDCDKVRQQFELEIGRRNTVEEYFGPRGLQAPFLGGVQGGALVDVAQIGDAIRAAVQPPPADNATSHALSIITFVTKIAGFSAAVCPPCGAVAGGVGGAFGLAAYLTNDDGSPDVVGPQVTAASAKLGGDLFDRYQRVSSYFTTEAKIIMSDWSKMSEVAAVATRDPKWALGDIATTTETIRLATKQAIYQALVPVAYPILYDLGSSPGPLSAPFNDARQWFCKGDFTGLTVDKHLFQKTGADAQLKYKMTDPTYLGQIHVFAVGGRHTVGKLHDAYVPAPPDSLTGQMFRDPGAAPGGGIGLFKLNFYSPQNFRLFPRVLQQSAGTGLLAPGYRYCTSMPDPPGNSG